MEVRQIVLEPLIIGGIEMDLLEGLKIIWSNPEIRKTAIKGVAAVSATGVATYAVTRVATRKWRKESEAYLAEPKTTMVDGELYKKMSDGTLVPYFAREEQDSGYDDYEECEACDAYEEPDDIIYIKGRPYVMDERGHYVPVRMPSRPKRRRR
ncbi:MAG: hypothetical protein Q4F52_11565 [Bacteroidaceae bacterium]|nr:hypothetical protein [Bacteroidaceae bacterium]